MYKNADTTVIELTGKRRGTLHSLEIPEIYKDTYLLKFNVDKKIISGQEIMVEPGYYKYTGRIEIKNDSILIDLFYNNTDDKRLDPVSYNGGYLLRKRN